MTLSYVLGESTLVSAEIDLNTYQRNITRILTLILNNSLINIGISYARGWTACISVTVTVP